MSKHFGAGSEILSGHIKFCMGTDLGMKNNLFIVCVQADFC